MKTLYDKIWDAHIVVPETDAPAILYGDSHTSTHGAFGALAHGIGTSEVEMVLATQCLLQRKSKNFQVNFDGRLPRGVTAKDMILALIAKIGTGGGTGHVFEFTGSAIRPLDMDARMTICNMAIEGGARAGLIAPDETTFQYVAGREFAPKDKAWDEALARWKELPSDGDAHYDKSITIDASALEPMITYGTNPGMAIPLTGRVPAPTTPEDVAALKYMALEPGQALLGHPIDVVFIGSCTNSRLSDLRNAAQVLRGRKVNSSVRMLVVPGSYEIKRLAEAE